MPLATNLNTNEVKDRSGAEVEFLHFSQEGRSHIYAKSGEAFNLPHRLKVNHQETGKVEKTIRRSLVRVDKTVIGKVSGKPVTISFYACGVIPVGDLDAAAMTDVQDTCANLISFLATTGAGTTVLFDGSGNGASCLINGTQ